jgi:hypothetical protein
MTFEMQNGRESSIDGKCRSLCEGGWLPSWLLLRAGDKAAKRRHDRHPDAMMVIPMGLCRRDAVREEAILAALA